MATTSRASAIRVDGLTKTYRFGNTRQVILDNATFNVDKGEIVALLGASGSGKTTLLNLLSGIDRTDSGSIEIAAQPIHTMAEPAISLFRRETLGFVFQFFNLIPTLTIAENIAFPIELVKASGAPQRVEELLEAVGLPGTGERYPETLSGGEQQRIAIARALAHKPRVLLADEPTGNLDQDTGDAILDLLVDLSRQQHTSMLIVTHSDGVAQRADRKLRLDHGQLFEA